MNRFQKLILLFILPFSVFAQTSESKKDSFPVYGVERVNSSFFKNRFQHSDLVNYLDNIDEYSIYQAETTGSYNLPDNLIFSVSGNSFKWNRYYLDGFRVDSRFAPGSNFYQPNILNHSLSIDFYQSILNYYTDSVVPNSLALSYNVGGWGGISPLTEEMVNLYHLTASQRLYKPIVYREKMNGLGILSLDFSVPVNGKKYLQQLYVNYGTRMILDYNESGISDYFPEDFSKIQLNGQLPINPNKLFDRTNYIFSTSQRQNMNTEFYMSRAECSKNNQVSFSLYGVKESHNSKLTSGLTFATNDVKHNDLNFYRNVVDQDGEAFEPWYPNGNTSELSHALNYSQKLPFNIDMTFDSYNSVVNFSPTETSFQNKVYDRNILTPYKSLYIYDWSSSSFVSGLLENTLTFNTSKRINSKTSYKANFDFTLDGMLLSDKSMVRPNWQAKVGLVHKPNDWFSMEFNFSRNRVTFNMDDIRYFSNDYMNGDVYYWKDDNNNQLFDQGEKSNLFTTTGGKYHKAVDNLKQQSYIVFDMPLNFTFGNSEFSITNSYRKYFDSWITKFDKPVDQYGFTNTDEDGSYYYLNNGIVNYQVGNYPMEVMQSKTFYDAFTNSPYYVSNTVKYQYSNKKFLFSVSWQSYLMMGISTMGSGPLHNNVGVYSESTANPNTQIKQAGRNDQDKAYIARILMSYKLNKNWNFAMTGKFKDGQPFSYNDKKIYTDANGNNQMAIWAITPKGINLFNGDFGTRKDAFFNIDFRTTFSGKIMDYNYDLQLMIYNLYDFGTELTEYSFMVDKISKRYSMDLNIPRGVMFTGKVYF